MIAQPDVVTCSDEEFVRLTGCTREESKRGMYEAIARMDELQRMSYDEYLRTEEWQIIRQGPLRLADGRCQVCNSDERLNVHHRRYPHRRGEEKFSDLLVLCRGCHYLFHSNGRLVR